MKTIQGPGIFLAQFASDVAPFNSFEAICDWAKKLGYVAVQIPSWDARMIDLKRAAESKAYCDEIRRYSRQARSRHFRTFNAPARPVGCLPPRVRCDV